MKRILLFLIALSLLIGGGIFAYQKRVIFFEWVEMRMKPTLPQAESYQPSKVTVKTTQQADKVTAWIPAQKHLLVPFTPQAPQANWDMPYQEACEEASLLMVFGYYKGDKGTYVSSTADRMILDLIAYEELEFGFGPDITVQQAAQVVESHDSSLEAEVVSVTSTDSIKQYIARGIPVIVPADGKTLPNPNFRNGGPVYHMLVITGYTEDEFITNDPGTRKGYDYVYAQEDLMNSIHDWNNGDVPNGDRVMLIIRPKSTL